MIDVYLIELTLLGRQSLQDKLKHLKQHGNTNQPLKDRTAARNLISLHRHDIAVTTPDGIRELYIAEIV